jgi:uncharacterized membrane protein HdeD (DUF308 family)
MIVIAADWRTMIVRGIAGIVFGFLALVWPGTTLTALVLLFGAYALVDGVTSLATAFSKDPEARENRLPLVLIGLAGIAAGLLTFAWPGITALALLFVIAAWSFVVGVAEMAAALRLRRQIDNEWLLGLSGALSIVFAAVLVITPGAGALAVTWLIGWFALIDGAMLASLGWRLRNLEREGLGHQGRARSVGQRTA